jgi:hypothetical protein
MAKNIFYKKSLKLRYLTKNRGVFIELCVRIRVFSVHSWFCKEWIAAFAAMTAGWSFIILCVLGAPFGYPFGFAQG